MSRPLFTATFWLDAAERLVKTIAQSALSLVTAVNVSDRLDNAINMEHAFLVVGLAGAASLLTSIISSGIGEPGTASVLNPAPPDTLNEDAGHGTLEVILLAAATAVLVFAILVAVSDSITF
jgi:hypothetical protein